MLAQEESTGYFCYESITSYAYLYDRFYETNLFIATLSRDVFCGDCVLLFFVLPALLTRPFDVFWYIL